MLGYTTMLMMYVYGFGTIIVCQGIYFFAENFFLL